MKIYLCPTPLENIYIAHASTEGYYIYWAFRPPTRKKVQHFDLDQYLKMFELERLTPWRAVDPTEWDNNTQFVRCHVMPKELTGKCDEQESR